jgi:excisionase family DNA binding protein
MNARSKAPESSSDESDSRARRSEMFGGEPLAVGPDQAAAMLGCGRTTIYELLARGELPSFQIGRRRLIRVAALEDLVRAREARREA